MIGRFTFAMFAFIASAFCMAHSQVVLPPSNEVTLKVGPCDFSLVDNHHGEIIMPRAENEFKFAGYEATIRVGGIAQRFGFDISCHESVGAVNDIAPKYGGQYETETGRWLPDLGEASTEDALRLKPVTKTFVLNSINGHGFYTIQDDLDGEPSRRMRHLSYCLFHGSNGICGDGQVKRLSDSRSDMLPYALKTLESVKFFDATPPSAPNNHSKEHRQ